MRGPSPENNGAMMECHGANLMSALHTPTRACWPSRWRDPCARPRRRSCLTQRPVGALWCSWAYPLARFTRPRGADQAYRLPL